MVFTDLFCSGPHPLQQVRGQQADPLHPTREECPVLEAGAAEVRRHPTTPTPPQINMICKIVLLVSTRNQFISCIHKSI